MSGRGGQEGGYLEDVGGFLTRDSEDRVIHDVMNHVFLPQGRYPENVVPTSLFEVCQGGGGGQEGGDLEDVEGF